MNPIIKKLGKKITGEIKIPGDKSISIRASIISSLFYGDYEFKNFNFCDDTKTCLRCMDEISKFSKNNKKTLVLNCKNSATTMRLLAGFICGAFEEQNKTIILKGDNSLSIRPMDRIVKPLKKMGANIISTNGHAPIIINLSKTKLKDITYKSNIASGQVKSSLEIAAYASGCKLVYKEPIVSRNHTKIMLDYMHKMELHTSNCHNKHCMCHNFLYYIPSDISTAAFFITNAIIYNDSKINIKNILMNKTRTGFLDTLKKSGIPITYKNKKNLQGEKVADIYVSYPKNIIKPVNIEKNEVVSMIDEIMLISLLLAKAEGVSHIKGLAELKNKESDRLKAICDLFKVLNIKYKLKNDNLTIYGKKDLTYQVDTSKKKSLMSLKNSKDHRVLLINKILNINTKYEKYLDISL